MKPRKIKITPKSGQNSQKDQGKDMALDSQEKDPKTRLVIKPKGEDYHVLRKEKQHISDSFRRFRRNTLVLGGGMGGLILILWAIWFFRLSSPAEPEKSPITETRYGYKLNDYEVRKDIVEAGQNLDDILIAYGVPVAHIPSLREMAEPFMDIDHLQEKSQLTVLTSPNSNETEAIIYEPNPFEYTVIHVSDSLKVYRTERTREIRLATASGIIDSALWKTILDEDLHYDLIGKMEEALQWSVDFYHLHPGDRFKLIFENIYADGELVEVGDLKAVYFQTHTKAYQAYYYQDGETQGFFDETARPMKRSFLQSPVKYARISSAFNLKRYHPVLKEVKPHLGTDYAAPEGTPILAVADGTISMARFGKNNGNYVKIRHDNIYETQYLHMSKFAAGIKKGVKVKQGDVIGFVGSTGLASGPHVCFRFWKNKEQVDHRTEALPAPNPLPTHLSVPFFRMKDTLEQKLAAIGYQ